MQATKLGAPRSADDEADAIIDRLATQNAGGALAGEGNE